MVSCHVVVVGAGPYGLSIAAHLKARGVNFRIFGKPMDTWLKRMPQGMHLKSEGFASCLYDPKSSFTLKAYCNQAGLAYADAGLPVPLDTFVSYAQAFQKKLVPELEEKLVASVRQSKSHFEIRLDDGEVFETKNVIIAVGLTHYAYTPPLLSSLPEAFCSHSSKHSIFDAFKGRELAIVGAGASALDIAALAHRAGVKVHVVARRASIRYNDPPRKQNWWEKLQSPMTGIGPGWKLVFCSRAPQLFRRLPDSFRVRFVRLALGPAPCWFTKQEVVGKVTFHLGCSLERAVVDGARVQLTLKDGSGSEQTLTCDHVISATGYRVDLARLSFLDADIQRNLRSLENTPVLSRNFESSIKGLFFVGTSAANMFGPLLRFAFGARLTAKRLSRYVAR